MNIERKERDTTKSLPSELVDIWALGPRQYEFRANGDYFAFEFNIPYQLIEGGTVLVFSGDRYTRLYDELTEIVGVWLLESDPTDEWNLRNDGTYTYHGIGFETFGEYSNDASTMSTKEFRFCLRPRGN